MKLFSLYCNQIPDFILEFASAPEMQRLKSIGMNCGCEYTSFPRFRSIESYSRYDHSVGTALIVWNFTHCIEQSLAALFHDISTPVFAHVIDFLNGDYLKQESTEERTGQIIRNSEFLSETLCRYGIEQEKVCDYHRYPAADLPSPQLCADRLEYTIGNMLNYGFRTKNDAKLFYSDITLAVNEKGENELCFCSPDTAVAFAKTALLCSKVYVSDEDRYSMQILSEIIAKGLSAGILSDGDLYKTEPECIEKLCSDLVTEKMWKSYQAMSIIRCGDGSSARIIRAKKRFINPYVTGIGRTTQISQSYSENLKEYRSKTFDYPIYGE